VSLTPDPSPKERGEKERSWKREVDLLAPNGGTKS